MGYVNLVVRFTGENKEVSDMKEGGRILKSVAIDTGGTMTDAVIMDTEGEFTVGKAVTTPRDESEGILNGMRSACGYWGLDSEEALGLEGCH